MRRFLFVVLLGLAGCRPETPETPASATPSPPTALEAPASVGSRAPRLASGEGRLLLSWLEPVGEDSTALRFSVLEDSAWTPPRTVTVGADLLVNGADTPSVVPLPGGDIAAHWLVRGPGVGYSIRTARSSDGGRTWTAPTAPHRDETATEHGFARLLPWAGSAAGVVWLDGRAYAGGGDAANQTAVRFTTLASDGTPAEERVLDARACDCCPTAAALTAEGPIVAYRDRTADETRDIAVVRYLNGTWTAPQIVHADGWKIDGCPVNGPAIAADGRTVVIAWFTGIGDRPHVRLAVSSDAGATFGEAIEVSDAEPLGRVAVALDGSSAAVLYLDGPADAATLRLRRVRPDGTKEAAVTLAEGLNARITGFPVLARHGDALVAAWTAASSTDGSTGLHTVRWTLAPGP